MSFSVYDFDETIKGCSIERSDIARVVAAWGEEGMCAEWSGGFLLELKSGKFVYVSGWCDTTGWGCQDGTDREDFDALPELSALKREYHEDAEWETTLPDLQKYIETGEGKWA